MYHWIAESKRPWTNGFVQWEIEMAQFHEEKSRDSPP